MVTADQKFKLPSTDELPCSDDIPVDNEDQNLLPNLLLFILVNVWSDRMDWYFGVDMGIYHTTGKNPRVPVVPDAFLSIGVPRRRNNRSRRSYATWEEDDIVPTMVLEMVSHAPGGEYAENREIYTKLGVPYYVIYNPEFWQRDQHQPFEVYKLVGGQYELQVGEPYWMPEVGLGIGRSRQVIGGIDLEILTWFDQDGLAYAMPETGTREFRSQLQQEAVLKAAEQRAAAAEKAKLAAQQRADRLAEYLRAQGIDPENLPS